MEILRSMESFQIYTVELKRDLNSQHFCSKNMLFYHTYLVKSWSL